MIDISKGIDFNAYIKDKADEHISLYKSTVLSNGAKEKINLLKEKRKVLVFSEGFCPDCTIAIPFMRRLEEENSNIELNFFKREGNEEFLEEAVGEARIPTILVFDGEMNPLGAYVEFPEELKDKIQATNLEDKKHIVKEFREGKYNSLIEESFLNILK